MKLLPTKKGICLRPAEYANQKSHVSNLEKEVPQLEIIVTCFMRDDHQNQLGMLEGRYSRFDHVPTACSYPNAPQKMIFYFLTSESQLLNVYSLILTICSKNMFDI